MHEYKYVQQVRQMLGTDAEAIQTDLSTNSPTKKVFYLLPYSAMLLEMHPRYKRLANDSISGFIWEEFDFDICNNNEVGRYTWAFFSLLCFAFGFPASVAILWEMFQTHRRGIPLTPNDFFILNISIMDAVFLAFIPPGFLNHFFIKNWTFEAFWNAVYSLNTCGRPLMMACVCFDCYLAVVHPIIYLKRKSLAPRIVLAGIVWTFTAANGIIYFLFFRLYFSFLPAVTFVIAIIIIAICDSFVVWTLVKPDPGRKNIHPQKQRAIQTLIYSLAMTIISYLPPVILFSIGRPLSSSFTVFVCTLALPITITSNVGSALMPLLYLYHTGKLNFFRRGYSKS